MYFDQSSGLAPEIAHFSLSHGDRIRGDSNALHNLLRPETVESLFILWRVTGDQIYREWGWRIFRAFERQCRIPSGGYSSIRDVTSLHPDHTGKMESFFTAETLKYLYLLFAESSEMPLDEYVFNTEAHPLRIHRYYE